MTPRAYPEKSSTKIFTRGKRGQCIKSKILTTSLISSRKAQMKLSFGMIFSIILIVIFLAFSFYAIQKFLGLQDSIKIAQFGENLQSAVNKAWSGSGESSTLVEYFLPSKIDAVCFVDDDYENLVFKASEFIEGKKIEHLNITEMIKEGDFCIKNINGKVKMRIEKDYGEALVIITEQ